MVKSFKYKTEKNNGYLSIYTANKVNQKILCMYVCTSFDSQIPSTSKIL